MISMDAHTVKREPLLSVLMANYNNGRYVSTAIESIIHQHEPNWELVLIDDCSTDKSLTWIKKHLADSRIRFISNKNNSGYINTLKKAIETAKAEIVGIVDSDDCLRPHAIETVLQAYRDDPNAGFVYSQFQYCDHALRPIKKGFCRAIPPNQSNLHCNCVSHFKTFKKEVYHQTNGYRDEFYCAEDKDIVLQLEEKTRLVYVDQVLYDYRILSHSQGHNPIKRTIGQINFIKAKHSAYQRRLGSEIPNLLKRTMLRELCRGFKKAILIRQWDEAINMLRCMTRL